MLGKAQTKQKKMRQGYGKKSRVNLSNISLLNSTYNCTCICTTNTLWQGIYSNAVILLKTIVRSDFTWARQNIYIYYPTLPRRVQITRETSTNITRYLYSSHSPDRAKDQKPWQVRILGKRKRWIINLLLDILVCSIAVNFYSSFVFWLALRALQNTAWLVKIYSDTTH